MIGNPFVLEVLASLVEGFLNLSQTIVDTAVL